MTFELYQSLPGHTTAGQNEPLWKYDNIYKADSLIKTKIESITDKLLHKVSAPLTRNEEALLNQIENLEGQTKASVRTIQNEIEFFKEERQKEEQLMKNYKSKFTEKEMKTQITPIIKKLKTYKQDLEKFKKIVKKNDESFSYYE